MGSLGTLLVAAPTLESLLLRLLRALQKWVWVPLDVLMPLLLSRLMFLLRPMAGSPGSGLVFLSSTSASSGASSEAVGASSVVFAASSGPSDVFPPVVTSESVSGNDASAAGSANVVPPAV